MNASEITKIPYYVRKKLDNKTLRLHCKIHTELDVTVSLFNRHNVLFCLGSVPNGGKNYGIHRPSQYYYSL